MITKQNIESLLDSLGFIQNDKVYTKTIGDITIGVDCAKQEIIYPTQITIHDKTTSNFSHPENFVVFECVHRLLQKGYKPEHLELEPRWNLGREAKGGKADILVRDHQGSPYLLIECKTTDSKNSEFAKEWAKMLENGGQLFSYFQQERGVKYLCLYTSDFNQSLLTYENYIISVIDNDATLTQQSDDKQKAIGYKDAHNNEELFKVWKETYSNDYATNGIFENEIQAYKITQLKPTFESLKSIDYSSMQRKKHQWATILRYSGVGDRGVALNRIMNLLLCKITDEAENKKDLQFSWGGFSADSAFSLVDRLQYLYQKGMQKYLNINIIYYSKNDIDNAFSNRYEDTPSRENIENIFNDLKYFQNGDFNFLEVHNKELFNKNFNILLQVVLMLEDIKFSEDNSQFLGDFFESYIHDMPQHEGQYFTPVPLVNFIIYSLPVLRDSRVLDFACGAGHFLSEYSKINNTYEVQYKGIDKDQRLAKISAIASFMYGKTMDIKYDDALKHGIIENDSINTIISNPPYSVDGFLRTLNKTEKESYTLFNKNISLDTDKIECFFIEKASQVLKSYGLLSLVLPSSIFSNNDTITIQTREILLKDFYIIAICEFGNQTFFKTGTQPIILFAIKKLRDKNITTQETRAQYFYKLIMEDKTDNPYKEELDKLLHSYANFMRYKYEMIEKLFFGVLENIESVNHDNFKEYIKAYNKILEKERKEYNSKTKKYKDKYPFTPSQTLQEFLKQKEAEKFLYFCYALDSEPLIIKAPKDNEKQKKFLGYYWSSKKGQEGIHYFMKSGVAENNINYIDTPLFNPNNRFCVNSISFAILSHFVKYLDSKDIDANFLHQFLRQEKTTRINEFLESARLIDMIDFSKVEFNKAISLNPHSNDSHSVQSNPFANSKYELVKLGEVCNILIGGTPSRSNPDYFKGNNLWVSIAEMNGQIILDTKEKITDEAIKKSNVKLIPKNTTLLSFKLSIGKTAIAGKDLYTNEAIAGLIPIHKEKILDKYLLYFFQSKILNLNLIRGNNAFGKSLNSTILKENIKIPLPPLEIQTQIVAECESLESRCNTIEQSIKAYQELIKAILWHCGITTESTKDFDSILMSLAELESKLDFELLGKTKQDSKAFLQNLTNTLNTLPTPQKENFISYSLNDTKLFNLSIGKRILDNELDTNGTIPVFSANVKKEFGFINKEILKDYEKDSVLWGIDGDWMVSFIPKGKKFYPTDHCGVLRANENFVDAKLASFVLEKEGERVGFSRNLRASIDRIKTLKISLPPLEIQTKITQSIETIQSQISFLDSALPLLQSQKQEVLKKYLF